MVYTDDSLRLVSKSVEFKIESINIVQFDMMLNGISLGEMNWPEIIFESNITLVHIKRNYWSSNIITTPEIKCIGLVIELSDKIGCYKLEAEYTGYDKRKMNPRHNISVYEGKKFK